MSTTARRRRTGSRSASPRWRDGTLRASARATVLSGWSRARCARWPEAGEAKTRLLKLFSGADFIGTALEETRAKHISRIQLQPSSSGCARSGRRFASSCAHSSFHRRVEAAPATGGRADEPEAIGISRERLRQSFRRATHIRRRFTVLDLAVRAGVLDESLDALFGPGGVWEI